MLKKALISVATVVAGLIIYDKLKSKKSSSTTNS